MRTRFLNADYFTTNSFTSPSSPVETLKFLNLPVSPLSPPRLSSCKDDLLCFDSVLDASLDIEQLPIHSALSKFLTDVIPEVIDFDRHDFENLPFPVRNDCDDETKYDIIHEEKEEEKSQLTFGSQALEPDYRTAMDEKNMRKFKVIQFETPEPDLFLENVSLPEKDDFWIRHDIPEIDDSLDMLNLGLAIQYRNEVQKSFYSVEDVALDCQFKQKTYNLEEDCSLPDQMLFQCIFPLLEVDEITLGILTSPSMEDEFLSVLNKPEHHLWTQNDNLLINGKEILGPLEYDILEFLLEHSSSKRCLHSELTSLDIFPEMDFISMLETSQPNENSEFHRVMADGDCFLSTSLVTFEEFEISDVESLLPFEIFFSTSTTIEPVICDWMFREDISYKNFNQLIISHELSLTDDTFKSLPTPVFSDHKKVRSVYTIMEEKLAKLKPQPLSASDGIYLDWHLLEGDKCSCKIFCCHQNMLKEINSCNIDLDIVPSDDEKLVFEFIFSSDSLSEPNLEGCKESQKIEFDGIPMLDGYLMGVSAGKLLDNDNPKPGNAEQSGEKNAQRASLFKSVLQFNDLDFFLNPQKVLTGQSGKSTVKEFDTIASSSNSTAVCLSSGRKLEPWDITLYKIKLSDNIMALIDMYVKSYLAIVQNETELKSLTASDDFKLLSLSKQQLMDCFDKKVLQKATSHEDENNMAFVILCAIKKMAWYTCFYGIHTACLYIDKLCKSWDCMKSRLDSLQSLIVDADREVDKEITRSHPSLLVIQGILRSNTDQGNFKVMILAEQAFWCSLKRLLMSIGLSCNELRDFCIHVGQPDVTNVSGFANAKMDDLLISDCLLVSHEFISASFPFNKFSLILEYGGSFRSSRISALSPNLAGLPRLHFLNVELSDSSASQALCEGVDMPQNIEVDGKFHSVLNPGENMAALKLQELLNFIPVEDRDYMKSGETGDDLQACDMPHSIPCSNLPSESEQVHHKMVPYPDTVIIVNTQNFEKEMIVSRRSTYQRILAMEKKGLQVVERDSDLPVDIIINSSICLVWYDHGNIGKKATAVDEASSCLPLCVENIATNVLTLLSFSFSACILVFEGESNFNFIVMESSDGLYAAAASLGLDLQIFCSYSSELTDDIILSCIEYSFKLTSSIYPKMPEIETLAEAFLTKFPSVNPLTAHAMLSSTDMLIEFLESSHEHRMLAVQKYHVPDESVILFSTLCKYGEREDSKSVMTDCSSSVSSGPDSDKYHLNIDSERKRQKCIYNPHKVDITDDFLRFEPSNQFTNDILNHSKVSKPFDSRTDHDLFDEYQKPSSSDYDSLYENQKISSSLNDMFGKKGELDFNVMMKPSRVSKACDSQILQCPQVFKKINDPNFYLKDKFFNQNRGSEVDRMNNLDWHNVSECNNLQEDFTGEVIGHTSNLLSGEEFFPVPKSSCLSPSVPEMENNSIRKSKIARRLSCKSGQSTFPTAAEINSGSDILSFAKVPTQSLQGTIEHPDTYYNNDKLHVEHRKTLLDQVLARRFASSDGVPFQEEISHYGGTPLSNAIHAVNPQPGSPWTVEFLSRIREKSRLRQQSLPCETAAPCGISGNISKVTAKRRNPSILEFFKYQRGNTPGKLPEQKKQKQSKQSSSSSKNKIPSTSFLPTWTPIDKRARQTLSFAVNESSKQTKLVWSDESAQDMRKKFRKH